MIDTTLRHVCTSALFVLYLALAGLYGMEGDWKRALYWTCCVGITAAVTL